MKIIQRLRNIWNLGALKDYPNKSYGDIDSLPQSEPKPLGYQYIGKPQAKIITRKPLEDNIDKVLKNEN